MVDVVEFSQNFRSTKQQKDWLEAHRKRNRKELAITAHTKKTSRRSGRRVVSTDGKPTGTGVRHTPILFGSRDPQERLQSMLVDT